MSFSTCSEEWRTTFTYYFFFFHILEEGPLAKLLENILIVIQQFIYQNSELVCIILTINLKKGYIKTSLRGVTYNWSNSLMSFFFCCCCCIIILHTVLEGPFTFESWNHTRTQNRNKVAVIFQWERGNAFRKQIHSIMLTLQLQGSGLILAMRIKEISCTFLYPC